MDDFKKIDLSGKRENKRVSNRGRGRSFKFFIPKKTLGILIGLLVLFVIGSVFLVVLPAQRTVSSARATVAQARIAYDALKQQNIEVASVELDKTNQSLLQTQKDLQSMSYLKYIPLVNNYYNDADHMVQAGLHGLKAGDIVVESVEPYADVLGLKGQGSFTAGSAEQRIQTAIMTMGKITPRIDDVANNLVLVKKEIDQVDENHYPPIFGLEKYRNQLVEFKKLTDEGVDFVDQARPLIKVLPSLLGEDGQKRYLVLFQNDAELRPTGGFITAYALFTVDKGVIKAEKSEDIYTLDATLSNKEKAPAPIAKYLPTVTTFNLRDANLSPDFINSMETFREMYENAGGSVDVDGIIAIDTNVLVSIIKILDNNVSASGITFTTDPDKRCGGCPQVIYELEDNISRPVGYIREDRKGLLGTLLYAIMDKALKSSPKEYWGPLIQDALTMAQQKHVLFYLYDKDAQSGIEALNAAGRIQPFEGDYFHLNQANLGGAKSNLFVQETVEQNIEVSADGTITKTVTVNYKNPQPPSDCNLERGGLCLNATLRDWVRLYVPKGSKLISSQGSEVKMTTTEDLGKTVFDGFITVRPLGQATLTLKYQLPFKLAKDSILPLLIQKQPGTKGNVYTIKTNGRKVEEFPLNTDTELELKI